MSESYTPPWYAKNPHLQIILKEVFTKSESINYDRETIHLEDGDFLDLDWLKNSSSNLVVISHGLEGSTERPYVTSLAKELTKNNYDVLAWNMRGCSGRLNNLAKFYHSGLTTDLKDTINYINKKYDYKNIYLVGFSIGGNITLKYLGEGEIPSNISKAICFSVPIDLHESAKELSKFKNRIYMKYFLDKLIPKIKEKSLVFNEQYNLNGINKIKNFIEFDGQFTAPLNGFKDVYDYYQKASSKDYIESIKIKTVLISAKDDPFLNRSCYPINTKNPSFSFTLMNNGSHMAFLNSNYNWINKNIINFLKK